MINNNQFEKFYNSSLRFLSFRIRSEKEALDYLKKKKADPEIAEKVIEKLKKYNFINDEEFARQWIGSRGRFKPRSMRLIKIELKQKGISGEIIEKLINDEGLVFDDLEQARKLVEKKIGRSRNKFGMTREETYQKLGRFLAAKGFSWSTAKKAIDETLNKGV